MISTLEQIKNGSISNPELLQKLIGHIRPPKSNSKLAAKDLESLIGILEQNPSLAIGLRNYLVRISENKNFKRLLSNSGIPSSKGFFRETYEKVAHFFLPPVYADNDFVQVLSTVFKKTWDYQWIETVPVALWAKLLQTIGLNPLYATSIDNFFIQQTLNSILVLSQRVATLGLEPELLDKLPELDQFESPFLAQSQEINQFLQNYSDSTRTSSDSSYKHILVMLGQCESYIHSIRKNKTKYGASLHLTHLIQRIEQNITRLRHLLAAITKSKGEVPFEEEIVLFKTLIRSENKKNSLSEHFGQNLNLLAFQVTEHASKTGEHYITSNKKEWWEMMRSAIGGGIIVGFLTIFKTLLYYLKFAPFGQAFVYSMNYSFGFIAIHLTHSTLATKQPAMTASKLASSLDIKGSRDEALNGLVDMISRVSRSQFIAFVGNVLASFPIAYGLAWFYFWLAGEHIADPEKAHHMIDELHPWRSLALFHAAITGVYLFISGLISGYYDNKNIYNRIALRINHHPTLKKIFGTKYLGRLSNYIDNNLGSLAGNFVFGIFLGFTGTIGFIFGLPIDIRHITFSAGNFGIALVSLDHHVSLAVVLVSVLGIIGIGFINFIVSFTLATFVAIKSRNVNFKEGRTLFIKVGERFFLYPREFFLPPKQIKIDETQHSDSSINKHS